MTDKAATVLRGLLEKADEANDDGWPCSPCDPELSRYILAALPDGIRERVEAALVGEAQKPAHMRQSVNGCVLCERKWSQHTPAERGEQPATQPQPEGQDSLDAAHPEAHCQRCGDRNPVWYAPSPLWNEVMRADRLAADEWGVVCPRCFAELAETKGIGTNGAWRWEPEEQSLTDAWQEAETALHVNSYTIGKIASLVQTSGGWVATAEFPHWRSHFATGPTPAAALRALAKELRAERKLLAKIAEAAAAPLGVDLLPLASEGEL